MATFAPPVRRGDFLYSSVLYADSGNGNHHPRASGAELAALLRPEAPNLYTKGRKPEVATPAKDPVWHYYSAQLLHYGLPFTKDKNGAKVRLLNAMNQVRLEVPAWILDLEGELKKEWEAENRKLKKGSTGAKSSKGAKADSTRGQSTGGVKVTVNLTLSPGLPMTDHLGFQQTRITTPKKPSQTKRKRDDSPPTSSRTPQKTPRVKKEPSTKRPNPSIKQEHPTPSTPSRPHVKKENTSLSPQYNPTQPAPPLLLSGTYTIHCPTATTIFNAHDLTLTLSRDPHRGIWWSTFRWGAWDGIIQMNPGPSSSSALDRPCTLGWRIRDLETGRLTFGRKCTGEMTFFSHRGVGVRGCLFEVPEVGMVEFEGWRVHGGSCEDDLRREWDMFVTEAYQR